MFKSCSAHHFSLMQRELQKLAKRVTRGGCLSLPKVCLSCLSAYLDAKPVVRHDWTWDQSWALVKEAGRFSPEAGLLGECMLAFGIGPGEVQGLRGEHFDFDRKCLHAKRQKTGEPYDIPFWPWTQPLLDKINPLTHSLATCMAALPYRSRAPWSSTTCRSSPVS